MNKDFEILKIGVPNKNGRIYPKETVEKIVLQAQEQIDKQRLIVVGGEVDSATVNILNAAALATNIKVTEDKVTCNIRMLDTPMGNYIKNHLICEDSTNPRLGVKTVGVGNLKKNEAGQDVVTNYELQSLQFVYDDQPVHQYYN